MEGCAASWYLTDLMASRPGSDVLRDAIGPAMEDAVQLTIDIIEKSVGDLPPPQGCGSRGELLDYINCRLESYSKACSLSGVTTLKGLIAVIGVEMEDAISDQSSGAVGALLSAALLSSVEKSGALARLTEVETSI